MKKHFISHYIEIAQEADISDQFLVMEPVLLDYRNKSGQFLSMQLQDRSGKIRAVLWENAMDIQSWLKSGMVCDISGKMSRWRNDWNITIEDISKSQDDEVHIDNYLRPPGRPLDEMKQSLRRYMETIEDKALKKMCLMVIESSEISSRFFSAPAAKAWHHSTASGLLEHTLSMLETAAAIASFRPELNRDLLLAGVIFHDIGKIQELEINGMMIDYSLEGRLVGHIALGLIMADKMADKAGLNRRQKAELLHLVASHHGSRKHGSPQVPMMAEAFVLHFIDDLDAQVNGVGMLKPGPDGFTSFCRLLDRYIYFSHSEETQEIAGAIEDGNRYDNAVCASDGDKKDDTKYDTKDDIKADIENEQSYLF